MRAYGYLRKGDVFSMYGKQLQDIEAYDEGLQNTATGIDQEVNVYELQRDVRSP